MRTYELTVVLTEEAGKEKAKAQKEISALLDQVKGKVKKTDIWGVKDLAYPIKNQLKGWYGYFDVSLDEKAVEKLDKVFKINENILRYLLVRA